jgi:DNA-binding response OmpR family regulator
MFSDTPVLIVEDNVFLAVDLSEAVEELDGTVVGPTNRISTALELLDSQHVSAAIVDAHLTDLDVFMLTSRLTQLGVPFVLQADSELPKTVEFLHPEVPVLRKPIHPRAVLTCLLGEMRKNGGFKPIETLQPRLGYPPKLV